MRDIPPHFIGLFIPIFAILMPVLIVGIVFWYKARDRELQAHQEMQVRQMEHERRMKEIEIEKAKIELEKTRVSKTM
jgi:hypothetical protein